MTTLGYLETDYATIQYGGGIATKVLPSQFEAVSSVDERLLDEFEGVNTVTKFLNAQFEAVVNNDKVLNTQLEALRLDFDDGLSTEFTGANPDNEKSFGIQFYKTPIKAVSIGQYLSQDDYATYSYASPVFAKCMNTQFFAVNTQAKNLGLQFEGKITTDDIIGVQFEGKITSTKTVGSQFESFIIKTLNTQFRAVIYNTTQLRFLYEFPSRGINGLNWTASSTAPSLSDSFSVYNLNTDIVEQAWRSDLGGSQILTCDTQDTGGVFLDTLAILEHNITRGGTVFLLGSNDNFITAPFSTQLKVEDRNMYYIAPDLPLQSYRYWRIEINDVANPDGYIQIGSIVFGSSIVFSSEENITEDVDFGITQYADTIFTEGFTNISNDRGQKRQLGFKFQNLQAQNRNFIELRRMFEAVGNIQKVLWIPTPQDASEFAVFAKMKEVPRERHKQMGQHYVSLNIDTDESL